MFPAAGIRFFPHHCPPTPALGSQIHPVLGLVTAALVLPLAVLVLWLILQTYAFGVRRTLKYMGLPDCHWRLSSTIVDPAASPVAAVDPEPADRSWLTRWWRTPSKRAKDWYSATTLHGTHWPHKVLLLECWEFFLQLFRANEWALSGVPPSIILVFVVLLLSNCTLAICMISSSKERVRRNGVMFLDTAFDTGTCCC